MVLFGTSLLTSLEARGWVMALVADRLVICYEAAKSTASLREISLLWTDLPIAFHFLLSLIASVLGCLLGTRLRNWFCKRSSKRPSKGKSVRSYEKERS